MLPITLFYRATDAYVRECDAAELPLWWPALLPLMYAIMCGLFAL